MSWIVMWNGKSEPFCKNHPKCINLWIHKCKLQTPSILLQYYLFFSSVMSSKILRFFSPEQLPLKLFLPLSDNCIFGSVGNRDSRVSWFFCQIKNLLDFFLSRLLPWDDCISSQILSALQWRPDATHFLRLVPLFLTWLGIEDGFDLR
jgi:hypothetical protein